MYEVLVDRVNTTATVWLGSTLACAQCHNHKYDPFSQKDYFRLLAFFANTAYDTQSSGDGTRYSEAKLDLATAEQTEKRNAAQAEIKRLETLLATATPELAEAQRTWEGTLHAADRAWTPLAPRSATATNGVTLTAQPDQSVLASGPNPSQTTYTVVVETPAQGLTALRLDALPDASLPRGGPGRDAYGHFRVTGLHATIAPLAGGDEQPLPIADVLVDDSAYPFDAADLLGETPSPSRKRGSWAVNAMSDKVRLPRHAVLKAVQPFGFPGGTRITLRIDQLDGTIGQGIGRFRIDATAAADQVIGPTLPPRLRPILDTPPAQRSPDDVAALATAFRQATPALADTRAALKAARKALVDLQIPSTLVMADRPGFERPSYELRERGSFTSKGERQFARTPTALPTMKDSLPINRLGLARWLVDRDNPLAARVQVNRLWEQLFGRGLVETSEDFGTQGAAAVASRAARLARRRVHGARLESEGAAAAIVTSAAYRQTSTVPPALAEQRSRQPALRPRPALPPRGRDDPRHRRSPPAACSARRSHGPSVFPAQPDGIWNMPYNEDRWVESTGEDRYRRSLYTFIRRTSPYPMHLTFDATSREYCTVRRVRTNTPLQALTLLNDAPRSRPRARSRRASPPSPMPPGAPRWPSDSSCRASRRPPSGRACSPMSRASAPALRSGRPRRRRVAATSSEAAATADAAAWTLAANVLLNLDEAVTKN